MKRHLYTIQIIPEDSSKTRVFRISKVAMISISIATLLMLVLLILFFSKISQINLKFQTAAYLKNRNAELEKLHRSYDSVLQELDTIFLIEKRINNVAGTFFNQKPKLQPPAQHEAISLIPRSKVDTFIHKMKTQMKVDKQQAKYIPNIQPVIGVISKQFALPTSSHPGHSGIDIATKMNDPVHATAPGVATFVGWKDDLGTTIIIDHGKGYSTLYAHLAKSLLTKGDPIQRDQIIGFVGMTGNTTGPHLHYEVRINGKPQNPIQYLHP